MACPRRPSSIRSSHARGCRSAHLIVLGRVQAAIDANCLELSVASRAGREGPTSQIHKPAGVACTLPIAAARSPPLIETRGTPAWWRVPRDSCNPYRQRWTTGPRPAGQGRFAARNLRADRHRRSDVHDGPPDTGRHPARLGGVGASVSLREGWQCRATPRAFSPWAIRCVGASVVAVESRLMP